MSKESSYSEIRATLDALKAPAVAAGPTMPRMRSAMVSPGATEHADRMDTQWAAERRAAALEEEAQRLRAEVDRLSSQLDYATALCLAGFRQ